MIAEDLQVSVTIRIKRYDINIDEYELLRHRLRKQHKLFIGV